MNEDRPEQSRGSGSAREHTPAGTSAEGDGRAPATAPATGLGDLLPAVSLPRGGGALRGIGEAFEARAPTGSASLTIPIAASPSRGASPSLALRYDSGTGNGPFGLGWVLSGVPGIRRKTERGLPRYDDAHESDVFVLSDAEDLVPLLERGDGTWVHRSVVRAGHVVHRYRPRVEGAFARIERWVANGDGGTHWRTWSRDNVLSIYGATAASQIVDPRYPQRVFEWLLDRVQDDRGNVTVFEYKPEDLAGVEAAAVFERGRLDQGGSQPQRYLKRIHYGNRSPGVADDFAFELVFDYGEHGTTHGESPGIEIDVSPEEVRPWPTREDPFSQYRAGFEVRTWRLCRRALMFHRFPEQLGAPQLVASTDFVHAPSTVASMLTAVIQRGYERGDAAAPERYRSASWPALSLEYAPLAIGTAVRDVDPDSLRDVPGRIDGQRVRLVDLDGEGLPGLLVRAAGALYYKRPEGDARFGPARLLPRQPNFARGESWSLADLDGDGRLSLARMAGPTPGAFAREGAVATAVDRWTAFQPFVGRLNVDLAAPNVFVLDATGDGLADVVVFERERVVVYPSLGRDGFGKPVASGRPAGDEREGPRLLFGDATRAVFLADMGGDGLSDLVRIENGRVVYWPNLGYGRFGRMVEMGGAPWFDRPDRFRADRIRLGDIDGSGTADLLYFGSDGARVWINGSGNRYGEPTAIDGLPRFDGAAAVELADLLGTGCAALVWSSALASLRGAHVKFVDLTPGGKPYLLRAIDNGMGLRRTLEHGTSTRAYLQDRAAGQPWITRVPFVVHTLSRVVVTEAITQRRFATRYRYRHGYYDGAEREFRGFAVVEQTDAESFGHAFAPVGGEVVLASGHQLRDGELLVPPVLTRTRFHTGAWLDADALGDAIAQEDYRGDERDPSAVAPVRLPASVLPLGLSPAEQREAMRALRGRALRQEVYALSLQEDGNAVLERPQPYRVVEGNATVRLVQPRAGQRHAVFFVHEREALEQHYERDASDPRLSHRVILAVDDFGSVTRSAAISYRRRLPAVAGADQSRTRIVYGEHDVVNLVDAGDALRIGVPISSRSFEVTGVPDGDPVLSFEVVDAQTQAAGEVDFEARDAPGLLRRRLQSTRQLYWADDLAGPLPFGEVGTHALPHEERRMVATRARIAEVFAGLLPEAGDGAGVLDVEGGYVAEGGAWWSRSGYQVFDPAAFFLPAAAVDAFGNTYAIAYDTHHLAVVSVSDPRGNVTTATHDYRVLQPASVMDANGNRAQAMFDALGLVTATVRMGKAGDEDGDSSAAPTVRITYDLHAFAERGAPASSHTLQREQYGSVDADARVLESWTHYDGTGRVVQTKAQAEPGQAPVHDVDGVLVRDETGAPLLAPTTTRWVGSGRTVVDNKGNPIKQYEPFFSDRPDYDGEDELSRTGVTPLLHYDPFGRLVRTDFPDGTAARVEITSWSTTSFDRNDTVLESAWLLARGPGASASERRAAQLASAHANTPAVSHFDVLGRGVLVEAQVVVDGALQVLRTQTELDIEGNAVRVIDARGNVAESRIHAMGGVLLMVESADAGWRRALVDVAGAPLRSWNARGFASRAGYDALRRGTHAFVTPPGGVEMLVTRTVWGEAVATAVADNLRGRVFRVYDGAGEHTNVRHDFAGNLLQQSVRLNRAFEGTQDWSALGASDEASDPDAIAAIADASLESTSFVATMQYDALGRVVSRTTPDGSETRTRFNEAGLLEAVDVRVRGAAEASAIVTAVDYDARGQRLRCVHGNGTTASYAYEPDTFRLSRMRLVRSSDDAVLQDLRYTYDPVGNIVEIRDGAQQRVYFDNDVVGADQRFEYDALYRLSFASGRELRSLSQSIDADLAFGPQPHADDPAALRTYEETYAWDAVGNIVELRHVAAGGNFTRRYAYATGGNRLLRNSAPGEAAEPFSHSYAYDEHGNMTGMPHLAAMAWDHADRLQHCDLGGGGEVWFVYDASGARVRKVQRNASGSRVRERVYLGEFELYRERAANDVAPTLERETLHVGDGARRLCLVETLTVEDGERVAAPVSVPRFQHGNHLDSAALELDGEAAVISYEEFHPFGTTSYAANDAAVEVSPKRYRYISKERDEETGLYHLGARYYASWLGRWTAADPIGLADGVNRYAYCRGNPVGFRDTTGSARESVAGALVLHQNELVEAMNGAESPSTADALRAELATVTGELVHELVDLARRQEARDQLRRLDVSARIQAGASEATHGSMSTGTPTDAIDRAFDPRELQRAELAQMSSLGFIANGAFQKASVVLEEAGLIAPMSDQERRVRGLSAGDMLDNLSAFSGNGTRPMSGRTPAPSRAPLKNRSGTIDDASRTRRTHPAAAESRGSQAAERPVAARGAGRAAPELSTAAQRSIRSLEGRLAEHESKLVAYRENPFAFDNRGDLARNAARPEVQQRIIDGRIRHLEGEIRNFQQQLERLRSGSVEP